MHQPQPGESLGPYRLASLVSSSGMAAIFCAWDEDRRRRVAIKVPHPQAECDPVFYERFQREIQIGQKLDHKGILKALDSGTPDRVFMAMEWLDGRPLRHILAEQGKLGPDPAIAFALKICDALEHMHSHGVVHRDLKPENIMVCPDGEIKIIDFGIASLAGARRLTFGKLSEVMGSPDYISPEQVKGKRGDARSDVYALGVMLYEMLTGRTPFHADNALAIMNERLLNHPRPPRDIEPSISPHLQEIVYRALERDPANRYASARELAWDLAHPLQVGIEDRAELKEWNERRSPGRRRLLSYAMLVLLPVAIFALLLVISHRS
jgi:serine/threonine-protein kinase